MYFVDLGDSFQMSIYLQKSASIQPRTSPPKCQVSFPSRQFSFTLQSPRPSARQAGDRHRQDPGGPREAQGPAGEAGARWSERERRCQTPERGRGVRILQMGISQIANMKALILIQGICNFEVFDSGHLQFCKCKYHKCKSS